MIVFPPSIINASGNYITIEVNNKIVFSTLESFSNKVEGNEFGAKMINLGTSVAVGGIAGAFTGGAGAAAAMAASGLAAGLIGEGEDAKPNLAQKKLNRYTSQGGTWGAAVRGAGMGALQTGIASGIRSASDVAISNETYHHSTFYHLQNKYYYGGRFPLGLEVRFSQLNSINIFNKNKSKVLYSTITLTRNI